MTQTAGQLHAHTEQWELQPGLSDEARALAMEVLPLLRQAKSALIELGGRAIVGASPDDLGRAEAVAAALAGRCHRAGEQLGAKAPSDSLAPLQTALTNALSSLQVWAEAVVASGGRLSGDAAAGLREAYVQLRGAADPFWQLELVPEGRTHATERSGRQR